MTLGRVLIAWGKVLRGHIPMLSIEITRECPLTCPGCYAYGDAHLGGEKTLRQLSDLRDEALVAGVLDLVNRHGPIHVSIVGGEPLMRRRELDRILPALSSQNIYTLVVTSGVIPIPAQWMALPRLRVAVSVDGLPEHHNPRRAPATYEKILRNIEGRQVNIHLTVTAPMLERQGYLEEYMAFWSRRPEVCRIWFSVYTPQKGERSPEMLSPRQREELARQLPALGRKFPALLMQPGIAEAFARPPSSPSECLFSQMSVNYSADLNTRVEPCVFGGQPDCGQCGCAISAGLHWMAGLHAGPLRVSHFVNASTSIGRFVSRLRRTEAKSPRWQPATNHSAALLSEASTRPAPSRLTVISTPGGRIHRGTWPNRNG